jgi:hypothetical protein
VIVWGAAAYALPVRPRVLQIRPGDLIAVEQGHAAVVFAILTKQILFGGHWSYVFHGARDRVSLSKVEPTGPGFNAAVDFIVPKRENRLIRISRANDFSSLMGPELLQQQPAKGETNYHIWRWRDGKRIEADRVRVTASPTREERSAPEYACMPAEWAFRLASRHWEPHMSIWQALQT